MKNYKYSIIYLIILVVVNYFHPRVERFIAGTTGRNFAVYLIYGLFLALFLTIAVKTFLAKKNPDIAIALLTMGLIFFFLFSRSVFLFKLSVLELFLLGLILALEGKKSKSLFPYLMIAAAAVLVELAGNLSIGSHFYYLDAWRNAIIILSGFLAGFIL